MVEVPEGPTREDVENILQKLPRATRETPVLRRLQRRTIMKYRKPSLVALLLVIGCGVGWFLLADKRVAFADVLEQIRESQTISFRSTIKAEGFPTTVARQTMAAPRYVRIQMKIGEKGGAISIFDHEKSAGIVLMPATKQAIKMTSADNFPKQAASIAAFMNWLKTTPDHADEDLGPRKIDGQATFGFRVSKEGQQWEIWVEQKSNLPLRMETTMEMLGKTANVVVDEFAFDPKLNLSLFSLTPPAGYTMIDEIEVREPSEEDVVAILRHLTVLNDGEFPPDMSMLTIIKLGKKEEKVKRGKKEPKDPNEAKKAHLKEAFVFTRGLLFLKLKQVKYTGRGVKLGDAEKIVAWWMPEGEETFRAIHGDLSISNGDAKQPPSSK
jgi:outer membrane lipoprotein-sorting protein